MFVMVIQFQYLGFWGQGVKIGAAIELSEICFLKTKVTYPGLWLIIGSVT